MNHRNIKLNCDMGEKLWCLSSGPIAKAVVLDNNGNLMNSVAHKAAKVKVSNGMIDQNDTAIQKTVKAKAVRGDYRKKRKIRREVR